MSSKNTQTDSGQETLVLESVVAREIAKEIIDFGVTQEQILKICKFLVLELEDISIMKDIAGKIDKHIQKLDLDSSDTKNQNNLITEI
ncbi:hypothetical protein CL614_06880 [archaeon]|nr:hypothetical protein [archaeon]|tara:strand:+ start:2977 stop:3240 length:264 start_codon:yes stop_codon:yes gene_type:complete